MLGSSTFPGCHGIFRLQSSSVIRGVLVSNPRQKGKIKYVSLPVQECFLVFGDGLVEGLVKD